MEYSDLSSLTHAERIKSKTDTNTDYVKKETEKFLEIDFDNIYTQFNENKPLEIKNISKYCLKWYRWNIFKNFIDFCDYLINKINNSTKKIWNK